MTTDTTTAREIGSAARRELADRITNPHEPVDPAWRAAVAAVPRELFIDDAYFRHDATGYGYTPVRRDELNPEDWLRTVHSDRTLVTQVDGHHAADATGPVQGVPTSSSTQPSLVVRMLQTVRIKPGDRVLEIGTGTGYSTALLCHRLGQENVTSVEYDPAVAARAARHLTAAGYPAPHLATGDGLRGHPADAEYDAVVATCAIRSLPPSWLFQLRDGGTITATLGGWLGAFALLHLTVDDTGTAHGRLVDVGESISYMSARPHQPPPHPTFHRHPGHTRPADIGPDLLKEPVGHLVAQLGAPSAVLMRCSDGTVILWDVATGSQAWLEPDGSGWTVHEDGPLRLWSQVEEAWARWLGAGKPDHTGFGVTATTERQVVWLGSPDGPHWDLPC
ncbi:ATP-grasp peptide maturase system methyltransferase [Streptomyces sp. NPDC003077]|uniref:ATP-grasp peptide maturase system methyltransferase n=1 Tax=Streptomyces sp. NPDC003077 TaxID=3154443 RepID=UPI0033B98ED1